MDKPISQPEAPEEEKTIGPSAKADALAPGEAPETQKLREELEKRHKKADEYLNGWKRAKADYINRQKEIERERGEFFAFATATLLHDLLPIYETFVKACREMPGDTRHSAWGKGALQIEKNFDGFFKKMGVARLDVLGKKFNPEEHEAVGKRKEERKEAGTIIEEAKPGYTLHGKPFITSKVIIAE